MPVTTPTMPPGNGKPVPVQDFAAAMRAAREPQQASRPARERTEEPPKVTREP